MRYQFKEPCINCINTMFMYQVTKVNIKLSTMFIIVNKCMPVLNLSSDGQTLNFIRWSKITDKVSTYNKNQF